MMNALEELDAVAKEIRTVGIYTSLSLRGEWADRIEAVSKFLSTLPVSMAIREAETKEEEMRIL